MEFQRRIPLHHPQQFPQDWHISADFPTEEQLKRQDYMDDEHYNEFVHTGINIKALVYATMHAFSTSEVPAITFAFSDVGSFNDVLCIAFSDRFKVAARVPRRSFRVPTHVECTVAMMTFARNISGIPVPEVYAWNSKPDNPVGVQYILMEWVEGICPYSGWESMPQRERLDILDQLAFYHAKFAQPLPFQGIGNIYFADLPASTSVSFGDTAAYRLGHVSEGPFSALQRAPTSWPQRTMASLREFWLALWQNDVDTVTKAHNSDRSAVLTLPGGIQFEDPSTLGDFLDAAQNLLTLIRECPLPTEPELIQPCLVSCDYAFRNIRMDAQTHKITFFLDWDDVHVMPFLLCSRYPQDICYYDGADAWVKAGHFMFIPIDEEGEPQELADVPWEPWDFGADQEASQGGVGEEEKENEQEDGVEDEEEEDLEEDPEPGDESTTADPLDGLSSSEMFKAEFRRMMVMDTWHRRQYERFLASHDTRFGVEGFWEMRTLPLKIQYLITHGWYKWLTKCEWLEAAAAELSG